MQGRGIRCWKPDVSRLRVSGTRRSAAQAASLFVIAGALLPLPHPAGAHGGITPAPVAVPAGVLPLYRLTFEALECVAVTGDPSTGSFFWLDLTDEPYVVMVVADISARNHPDPRLRLPTISVTRTDVFWEMERGDADKQRMPLWNRGTHLPIHNPDDVIVLAAMQEHDNSEVDAAVFHVRTILEANLPVLMRAGWDRAAIVGTLKVNMSAAIGQAARLTGGSNPDDSIGRVQELRLTREALTIAGGGFPLYFPLAFSGPGAYVAYFGLTGGF
jgi:hypothetical protein